MRTGKRINRRDILKYAMGACPAVCGFPSIVRASALGRNGLTAPSYRVNVGCIGNADCKGKGSKYPHPELPFGSISSLAVWKDKLFVMDVLNRRLVKCNITYDPALKSRK